MKKVILSIIPKSYLLFLVFCLCACHTAHETSPLFLNNAASFSDKSLPRADNRYIGWLEKESILNACAEKIKIVAGTPFAWNYSSTPHAKDNIFKVSPVWLQINAAQLAEKTALPAVLKTGTAKSPVKILADNSELLKKAGISACYLYPTKSRSFENLYSFSNGQENIADSPISLSPAKETGTHEDFARLQQNGIQNAGNILPASLGTGSDFLLALHGVREYPGLFMMVEIPQKLWNILPPAKKKNSFQPEILTDEQIRELRRQKIIPQAFARDFFTDFPKSGFAVSNEITGYDGITRRWLYRYVRTPNTAVLNFSDPSHLSQRMLSASIIEEIGILGQGLVSVSVQDIWGQESLNTPTKKMVSPKKFNQPARFILEKINRSVHRYGAWTFCRDPLPYELIKTAQDAQTDFTADTLLMPALEQALLSESNAPLIQAFSLLKQEKIEEQGLWHGTQSCFSFSPFIHKSLTDLILQKNSISASEISQIKKMQENPIFRQNNIKFNKKLMLSQNMQTLILGFQSLLPGLNIIALQDLLGATNSQANYHAFTAASFENSIQNPLLFGSVSEQLPLKQSAINRLRPILELRQKLKLYHAKILKIIPSSNTKIFAFKMTTPKKQIIEIYINLSSVPQKTNLTSSIPNLKPYELVWNVQSKNK